MMLWRRFGDRIAKITWCEVTNIVLSPSGFLSNKYQKPPAKLGSIAHNISGKEPKYRPFLPRVFGPISCQR